MPKTIFVTASYKTPAYPIPSSCIEGAEYIIQSHHNSKIKPMTWAEGVAQTPHVIAEFGGGKTIDITAEKDFHKNNKCVGLSSYNFQGQDIPIGYGIIILNNTAYDASSFNMHLGAIVAKDDDNYYVSDVSENGKVQLVMNWPIAKIDRLTKFRADGYPLKNFAMGLLYPKP